MSNLELLERLERLEEEKKVLEARVAELESRSDDGGERNMMLENRVREMEGRFGDLDNWEQLIIYRKRDHAIRDIMREALDDRKLEESGHSRHVMGMLWVGERKRGRQ